jgi:hypothetical protein
MIVGINQYPLLQPLMHAQNDALDLWHFLVDEAGLAPERCLLLSDVSTAYEGEALYPDKQAIESSLQTICHDDLQAEDFFWLFFSGYGAQIEGEDYLLPVDSDPAQVDKTGIRLSDVFDTLQQSPTRKILLVLDINRSQSALAGQSIGANTIDLAHAANLSLLLSCEPGQFSHETLAVRHGLFTAALLEGLRYQGCVTLGHLADYLQERVPELCEHHWRPEQNPVAVIPGDQKFEIVVPQAAVAVLPGAGSGSTPLSQRFPAGVAPAQGGGGALGGSGDQDWALELPEPDAAAAELTATVEVPERESPRAAGGRWWLWGVLGALLLLLGVLLRNQPFFKEAWNTVPLPDWATLDRDAKPVAEQTESPETSPAEPETAATPDQPVAPPATAESPTAAPEASPATTPVQGDAASESVSQPEAAAPATAQNQPSGTAPANTAPANTAPVDTANAALLEEARRSIRPNQASLFADAIAKARQIRPGEPYYEQAQADIDRWSSVILDLAEGRAASGNLDAAMAAARLVPSDRLETYQQAQQRISLWQQRQRSRNLIREAQKIPKTGQASTYQRGILQLQQVPAGQPEFETAQRLINDWSQKMLSIARARAAQGRLADAIRAAVLIPRGTAAYNQAQTDLTRWRSEINNGS